MKKTSYRYNRADFRPLPVRLNHMDVYLDIRMDGRVAGTNALDITARETLNSVVLDARDLDVVAVEWMGAGELPSHDPQPPVLGRRAPREGQRLKFCFRRNPAGLVVRLPGTVKAGERFVIRATCVCKPSDHILEGIYKDTTPPGAPQQYMSQCQQWGFHRILPVFDDCTAKSTMVTTVEADARYTHLITNGNIRRSSNPDGRPVRKPGDPTRQVITYENPVPMAPYLFLVCAGTWDLLAGEAVYPSGRRVRLEYLVPPGRKAGARIPMQITRDAVLWQHRTQEYEYPFDVYRTICMEKSNFGGMENVGNTTIITSAALVDDTTDDRRLEYCYGVIAHEFEHNQCGSGVTMETPFDMWLNEAFTVDVDRQFLMSQFDADAVRLDQVDAIRAPIGGPLAIEDAGHMGNIVRLGFNDPDELVDGVTYVKAAEVIRMLRLVLGAETFRRAKNRYFRRFAGGNANTDQFFACFEEVSGRDLSQFRNEWLHTIGYPKIAVRHEYDASRRRLRVVFTQSRAGRGGLFHLPVRMAAVDRKGRDIAKTNRTIELTGRRAEAVFSGIPRPAFVSLNRDASFYGTIEDQSVTPDELALQVRMDSNRFNRVEAMRRLTDRERVRLLRRPRATVGAAWLDLYGEVLRDRSLPPGLKAYLLRIDEQMLDRRYLPLYRERCEARLRLTQAAAARHLDDLVSRFRTTDTYARPAQSKDGLEPRRLKAALLRVIVAADTPAVHALAEEHFHRAWSISDKLSALQCLYLGSHPRRLDLLEEGYRLWKGHVGAYSNYLSIIGSGVTDDTFDLIDAEERRPTFKLQHPNHSRSLFLPMTANNKLLWTERGIDWVTRTAIRMAPINEYTANRLVAAFQLVRQLGDDLRPKVLRALKTMLKGVDASEHPSTHGRIKAYLQGTG